MTNPTLPSNPNDEEVDRLLSVIYQIQDVQRMTGNSPRRGHEAALRAAVREWFRQNAPETPEQLCECGKPLERLWSCHYCGVVPAPAQKASDPLDAYEWVDNKLVPKVTDNETISCAKFRIGDDVVVTRWHAPAKVKGFIYELEEPFQYPERERDLSAPAQKASEPPTCLENLVAHNNAAVDLAHARGVRVVQLEDELLRVHDALKAAREAL